jgi:achaete-scute complex protein
MVLTNNSMLHNNKHIAPKCHQEAAKTEATVTSSTGSMSLKGCRRKIAFHHPTLGYAIAPPVAPKVQRRNARERNRVKNVNCGFEVLRAHIPTAAKQKKMSKVDTLRHAVEYIQNLQVMLNEKGSSSSLHIGLGGHHPMMPASSQDPQHQFLLPEQPQHYPLTPQTPTANMSFPPNGNESGYDTASSFYSTASPGLMSPTPASALPQYHHQQESPVQSCNSPPTTTSSVYSNEFTNLQQPLAPGLHQGGYNDSYYHEDKSEEDELLDVIAKWQED